MSVPIKRKRDGRFSIRLEPNIRAILLSLSQQLGPAVETKDPMTRRLFPPAYPGAESAAEETAYRQLVDTALTEHHRQALEVMARTSSAETLSESELEGWLAALGSLRLVLGTRLDVTEGMDPPRPGDPMADEYALFELLGELQYLVIEVLAADLPDEGRPEEAW